MRRHNNFWTDTDVERLKALVAAGVSANRAAVILKRRTLAVQNKARSLGTPFPSVLAARKRLRELGTSQSQTP
jgi:hypothetical protein